MTFKRASVKKVTPFSQVNNARAYSDCLALTALMRLGDLKCLDRETLARLGGGPYHRDRITRQAGSPF